MNWQLRLRSAHEPQRAPSAWFIPGDSPEVWLDTLSHLPLPADQSRLAIVPRSAANRSPLGALALSPRKPTDSKQLVPAYLQPYGCLAGRLYLPVEAVLSPPLGEQELDQLLPEDQIYVWHPASGLIPFAEQDLIAPTSLLSAPAPQAVDWCCALPGSAYNQRLLSLSANAPPTLEQLLEAARGDIGAQANHSELLPASPREAAPGIWAAIKRRMTSAVARMAIWLTGGENGANPGLGGATGAGWWSVLARLALIAGMVAFAFLLFNALNHGGSGPTSPPETRRPTSPPPAVPHSPWGGTGPLLGVILLAALLIGLSSFLSRPLSGGTAQPANREPNPRSGGPDQSRLGWLARLRNWATSQLQTIAQSLETARHRELERLLNLMDSDPDKGLRFALPLAGDAFRGVGPAGAKLTNRTVDYRAGTGYGTGVADVWNVREEYRRKLTLRYRELANREISLGRHRRAAYIFAELLGDWGAAADVLRDGGHYREAAVIYDERLRRPLDAAHCLARGGRVAEAIVIHERLKLFEAVGDLYAQLEQPEDAARSYRLAVQEKRSASDRLGAAQLLEQKLQAPEEAWEEIAHGWPHSPQAEKCLREAFVWTQRHNAPERAKQHIQRLAQLAQAPQQIAQLIAQTAELATKYPEPIVRATAATTTLAVASSRLPTAAEPELRALTAAVQRLAADDRLLALDCDRYARERFLLLPQPTVAPASDRGQQLELCLKSNIPFENIKACVASHDTIYAAGWRDQHLVIARGNWQGQFHYPDGPPWPFPKASLETPILLAVHPIEEALLCVHAVGQTSTGYRRTFPSIDEFPRSVAAGDFAHCSGWTAALQATSDGFVRVNVESPLAIHCYRGATPTLVSSQELTDTGVQYQVPIPFQARGGLYYFGLAGSLRVLRGGDFVELHEFKDEILQLVASAAHTKPRLIAIFERGAALVWGIMPSSRTTWTWFALNLQKPSVLLHPNGYVIAADRHRCEVYTADGEELRLHAAIDLEDLGEMVAILPAPLGNIFALCDSSGHLRQFKIPSPARLARY